MEDSSFLSLPDNRWTSVPAAEQAALAQLASTIGEVLRDPSVTSPEELAMHMTGIAERILAAAAGQERDLREMIAVMRTTLATTWDMYDKLQADRTTVTEHMERLREEIQGFEAELTALRLEGEAPPRE